MTSLYCGGTTHEGHINALIAHDLTFMLLFSVAPVDTSYEPSSDVEISATAIYASSISNSMLHKTFVAAKQSDQPPNTLRNYIESSAYRNLLSLDSSLLTLKFSNSALPSQRQKAKKKSTTVTTKVVGTRAKQKRARFAAP
jgi:hypothetical protein